MKTFSAAVMRKHFEPLSIEQFEHQDPTEGQVLVEMISSGLCGAQINEIDAVKGWDKYMPHFMGHEGFGQVKQIGDNVTKVKPGDYVVLHWRKGIGCDCFGGKYFSKLGLVGSGPVTTFAEKTIVSENRVTPVDYKTELTNLYPLMGCAFSTAYGIVKYDLKIKDNSNILITGAGGLGLTIAFWLKVLYNVNVTLVDRYEVKRPFVEQFGAKYFSYETAPSFFAESSLMDYCIDTSGNTDVISKAFSLLGKQGSLVLVGQPKTGEKLTLDNALKIFDGIKIFSSDGGNFVPENDLADIIMHIDNNIELANKLVTDVIGLEDINDGFAKMRNGEAGRIVINFKESIK